MLHIFISFRFEKAVEIVEIMIVQVLKHFAGETSIHGFSHIIDDSTSCLKRFIWTIAVIFALSYAGKILVSSFEG